MFGWLKDAIKGAIRLATRVVTTGWGLVVGAPDLVLGFLCVPKKNLRVQFFILSDGSGPVVTEAELQPAIDKTREILKQQVNVQLLPYGSQMVETIRDPAPEPALNPPGTWGGETGAELSGVAGDFFAKHLAGWNAVPISATFPITVFVVADVGNGKGGYAPLGPLTDYVLIDPEFIKQTGGTFGSKFNEPDLTGTAHEIGHACNLPFHVGSKTNLMYGTSERLDTQLSWYQKNLFRSSRHVLYW
jgi:hypothetical protein